MLNAIYYYFYLKPTFRIPSLLRSYGIVPKLHITGIEMDGKNNLFIQRAGCCRVFLDVLSGKFGRGAIYGSVVGDCDSFDTRCRDCVVCRSQACRISEIRLS